MNRNQAHEGEWQYQSDLQMPDYQVPSLAASNESAISSGVRLHQRASSTKGLLDVCLSDLLFLQRVYNDLPRYLRKHGYHRVYLFL